MKIVFTTRTPLLNTFGGMEKYILNLAKYLVKNDVEVEIIVPSLIKRPAEKINNFIVNFIEIKLDTDIKYKYYFQQFKYFKKIDEFLSTKNFDILHSFGYTAFNYVAREYTYRKPVLAQFFGNEHFKNNNSIKRIINYSLWYPIASKIVRNSNLLVSEGPQQTKEIIDLFNIPQNKIIELHDGVETEEIIKYGINPILDRAQLGIKEDEIVLVTVSRLSREKRVDLIINSFISLRKTVGNIKLIICGSGKEENNLLDIITNSGLREHIIHLKNLNDEQIFSVLSISDIFINASWQKVLLIGVLEALTAGLPVISVDDQEKLIDDKITGFICMGTVEGISVTVKKILKNNLYKKYKKDITERVKDYNWNMIAMNAIKYYEQLIKK